MSPQVTQSGEEYLLFQKFFRFTMIPVVAVLLTFALIAAPADAHPSSVSQGADYAVTLDGHRDGAVCDRETDGRHVTAYWYDADGFLVGAEQDGGDSGCDSTSFSGTANTVVLCEEATGVHLCTDAHKV